MRTRGQPGLSIERDAEFLRILAIIASGTGINTPKRMAEALGMRASTLMKYLGILRREGFLRYGEKSGKNQPYEIVWERLCEAFIDANVGGRVWGLALRKVGLIPIPRQGIEKAFELLEKAEAEWRVEILSLAKGEGILRLLRIGFEKLGGKHPEAIKDLSLTLPEFLKAFREAVIKARAEGFLRLENAGEDLRKLFDLTSVYFRHPGDYEWFEALKEIGLVEVCSSAGS